MLLLALLSRLGAVRLVLGCQRTEREVGVSGAREEEPCATPPEEPCATPGDDRLLSFAPALGPKAGRAPGRRLLRVGGPLLGDPPAGVDCFLPSRLAMESDAGPPISSLHPPARTSLPEEA